MIAGQVLGLLILLPACGARAAESPASPENRLDWGYVKGYFSDAKNLAESPAGWDEDDWLEAGAVSGVTAGLYFGADVPLHKMMRRNQSGFGTSAADAAKIFGNGFYMVPALGAAYALGAETSDSRLRAAALYGAESFALSGLAVVAVKAAAGRSRPNNGGAYDNWRGPGSSNSYFSFPSGHSVTAFSIAAVVATEYQETPLVPELSYGIATLTALSRVYQNQHWPSDVFFGGALGYFTAKAVLRWHEDSGRQALVLPLYDGRSAGLEIAWRF